jgi:hypothetical protein
MRNIMVGFAVVGLLAVEVGTPATARTLSASMTVVRSNPVQQADWDNCGSRCRDYREGHVRELERNRWAQNRGWEEHHRSEVSNRHSSPPPPFSYQHP